MPARQGLSAVPYKRTASSLKEYVKENRWAVQNCTLFHFSNSRNLRGCTEGKISTYQPALKMDRVLLYPSQKVKNLSNTKTTEPLFRFAHHRKKTQPGPIR